MEVILEVKDLKTLVPKEYEYLRSLVNKKNMVSTMLWDAYFMTDELVEEERWHRQAPSPIDDEDLLKMFEIGKVVYEVTKDYVYARCIVEVEYYQDIYWGSSDEVLFEDERKIEQANSEIKNFLTKEVRKWKM